MGLEWLSNIPWVKRLLYRLFRRLLEMYMAQEKLNETKKQVEVLKDLLVKETQEKYKYKEEVVQARQVNVEGLKALIRWIIDDTYKRIEEKFILVPKKNLYSEALLGHPITPPPENKDPKNADT